MFIKMSRFLLSNQKVLIFLIDGKGTRVKNYLSTSNKPKSCIDQVINDSFLLVILGPYVY